MPASSPSSRNGPAATSLPDSPISRMCAMCRSCSAASGGRLLGRPLRSAAQKRELIRAHRWPGRTDSPAPLPRRRRRCPSVPTTGAPPRASRPAFTAGSSLAIERAHVRASPAVMIRMPRRSPSSMIGPAPTSVFSRHRRSRLADVPAWRSASAALSPVDRSGPRLQQPDVVGRHVRRRGLACDSRAIAAVSPPQRTPIDSMARLAVSQICAREPAS